MFWYYDDRDRRLTGFPCNCFPSFFAFNPKSMNCRVLGEGRGLRYNKGGRIHLFSLIPLTSSASRRGNFLLLFTHSTPISSASLLPPALSSTSRRSDFSHSSIFSTSNFHSVQSISSASLLPPALLPTSRRSNFSHSSTFSTSNFHSVHSVSSASRFLLIQYSTPSPRRPRRLELLLCISLGSSLSFTPFPVSSATRFPPPLHTLRLLRPRLLAESTYLIFGGPYVVFPRYLRRKLTLMSWW
jgi:hypothetical protein